MSELAKKIYGMICTAIENRGWSFNKDEESLAVYFGVTGDDIPIDIIIAVDEEREIIRLLSPLPFKMGEDKRIDGALAICAASNGLADGSFDYNLGEGTISFRMAASFKNSRIGEGLIQYMISCACATIDRYNDKLFALNKGIISITEFLSNE